VSRQVLFIQGGGEGTHDEWDDKLVESLARELGDAFGIRYPRMPDEDDPSYAAWGPAIRQEMEALDEGAIVVGHSIGGTLLIRALAEQPSALQLGAVMLIATPFVGDGGWPDREFETPSDLGARLPAGVPVHVFHGLDDEDVPPAHASLYGRVIPQAQVHLIPGRNHQLGNDLAVVAREIGSRPEGA
jgi:predicted alpha/beta hydrolase family esterase